jgi:hypothetical protein
MMAGIPADGGRTGPIETQSGDPAMAKKSRLATPTLGNPTTPLVFFNDVPFSAIFAGSDLTNPIEDPILKPLGVIGSFQHVKAELHPVPNKPNHLLVTGTYVSGLKLVDQNGTRYSDSDVHAEAISGLLSITVKSGGKPTNNPKPKASYTVF